MGIRKNIIEERLDLQNMQQSMVSIKDELTHFCKVRNICIITTLTTIFTKTKLPAITCVKSVRGVENWSSHLIKSSPKRANLCKPKGFI